MNIHFISLYNYLLNVGTEFRFWGVSSFVSLNKCLKSYYIAQNGLHSWFSCLNFLSTAITSQHTLNMCIRFANMHACVCIIHQCYQHHVSMLERIDYLEVFINTGSGQAVFGVRFLTRWSCTISKISSWQLCITSVEIPSFPGVQTRVEACPSVLILA